ncbi:MAG: hypothetical protein KatS3mg115_2516 [Candidatus Poribacteria bacterium]|nr:MAG: hypothetical protein KatS3mg115_2516 [Candidatus Poribacteria bacterium]
MDRRTFLRISAISLAGTVIRVPGLRVKAQEPNADGFDPGGPPPQITRDGVTPSSWITPNDQFYVQDITGGNPPRIDRDQWKLIMSGLARKPQLVTFADLMELAQEHEVTLYRTLSCIGDPIGGNQIGNAEWTGIPLRVLIERAQPREMVTKIVFRCQDGYHTAIPLEDALDPNTVLVYKMNGVDLPPEHGYPVRLLNPGKYGQKCPKWIINMEFVAKDYLGYWETRGWSDEAAVRMATRIHQPQPDQRLPVGRYVISGSAFDGGNGSGIARVEVSTDGGKTWNEATIWAPGTGLTWSLWMYEWEVAQPQQRVRIVARSVNRRGEVQSATAADPFPAGAEGYHTVEVEVLAS